MKKTNVAVALLIVVLATLCVYFLKARFHGWDRSAPNIVIEGEVTPRPADVAPTDVRKGVSPDVGLLCETRQMFVSVSERREALGRLSHALNGDEIAAVTNFLSASGDKTPGLTLKERLALKNDALNLLQRQESRVPGLCSFLIDMLNDPAQPQGWRDYCLQGLADHYLRAGESDDAQAKQNDASIVLETYKSIFDEPANVVFRGTALRGIDILSRERPEIAAAAGLDGRIREVITNGVSDEGSLITALRMYAARGLVGQLNLITNIAERGATPLLRKVAQKTLEDVAAKARAD